MIQIRIFVKFTQSPCSVILSGKCQCPRQISRQGDRHSPLHLSTQPPEPKKRSELRPRHIAYPYRVLVLLISTYPRFCAVQTWSKLSAENIGHPTKFQFHMLRPLFSPHVNTYPSDHIYLSATQRHTISCILSRSQCHPLNFHSHIDSFFNPR